LKEFNIPLTLFKQILATNFPQSLIFLRKVINSWGQFLEVVDEKFEVFQYHKLEGNSTMQVLEKS